MFGQGGGLSSGMFTTSVPTGGFGGGIFGQQPQQSSNIGSLNLFQQPQQMGMNQQSMQGQGTSTGLFGQMSQQQGQIQSQFGGLGSTSGQGFGMGATIKFWVNVSFIFAFWPTTNKQI